VKPLQFDAPTSLDDAIRVLSAEGAQAAALSGGTDLIVQMRSGRRELGHMVDIKKIPELTVLEYDPSQGLRLGAAVPCVDLAEADVVVKHYPALAEGAELIGGTQIQSRATVGGNMCNASPAADSVCGLIVADAVCVVQGPNGRREIPAEEFMVGPGRNALQPGELLVEFRLPPPAPRSSSGYLRFIPRNEMDIAVASAGARITLGEDGRTCTDAKIAIGAVGPRPLVVPDAARSLVGTTLDEPALENAAQASAAAAQPITDIRGTEEYRRHMAGVLTKRAVTMALTRAKESR